MPNLSIEKHRRNIWEGIVRILEQEKQWCLDSALGNRRWTSDLILSTWYQAEYGRPPNDLEYRVGNSGGGFDMLAFKFENNGKVNELVKPDINIDIDLSIELNKGKEGSKVSIDVPFYGGGMSFGSVSLEVMLARAMAAEYFNTFTSTGEGGYPKALRKYSKYVITQVATGMFGVSEETIKLARIVELKYAQGAKPGLGGHLLADKVTAEVAKERGSAEKISLYSPFPFHSVYSVEDHKKHVEWIRTINPDAIISVKVSPSIDIDLVAIGIYYAGANIIHIDGGYGATGASPEIAKKNIAMPIEFAIPLVHDFLVSEGVRDEIVLIASGGIRSAYDIAKAIALGADGCVIGAAELIALGCTQCGNCERGRGCQIGIATTDPEFSQFIIPEIHYKKITNLYNSWCIQLKTILKNLQLNSIKQLVGRQDLLVYYKSKKEASNWYQLISNENDLKNE